MVKAQGSYSHFKFNRKTLLVLLVTAVVLYAVLPQIGKFRSSFDIVEQTKLGWLIAGLSFFGATYFVSAAIYGLLAKKTLRYSQTILVQLAGTVANKILPSGIGTLGINFEYLRSRGHSQAEAGAVVATNNLIGIVGHTVLLTTTLLITGTAFDSFSLSYAHKVIYIGIGILLILIGLLVWFKKLRSQAYRFALDALRNIRAYRNHPLKILGSLIYSILLTSFYALTLLASAQAVGLPISFAQALVVLTAGVAGGTVVPTPGGLGGAEAGLFAGLIAFKFSSPEALAAVLLYRLITYWLALIAGIPAALKLAF